MIGRIWMVGERIPFSQVTAKTCRWPIAGKPNRDMVICGHLCAPGSPYCEKHQAQSRRPKKEDTTDAEDTP